MGFAGANDTEDRTMIDRRHNGTTRWLMAAAAVAAGLLVTTQSARAGDWSVQIGAGGHGGSYIGASYGESRCDVAARRVLVEPRYTERRVRVRVPAVVRTRDIPVYDRYGNVVDYRVEEIVEPAYNTYRTNRVRVREGYYEPVRTRAAYRRHHAPAYRRHHAPAVRVGYSHHRRSVHHGHHRSHRRGLRVGFGIRH